MAANHKDEDEGTKSSSLLSVLNARPEACLLTLSYRDLSVREVLKCTGTSQSPVPGGPKEKWMGSNVSPCDVMVSLDVWSTGDDADPAVGGLAVPCPCPARALLLSMRQTRLEKAPWGSRQR